MPDAVRDRVPDCGPSVCKKEVGVAGGNEDKKNCLYTYTAAELFFSNLQSMKVMTLIKQYFWSLLNNTFGLFIFLSLYFCCYDFS